MLDDFETGSVSQWAVFKDSNSTVSRRSVSPGRVGNYAMQVDYGMAAGGWGGVEQLYGTPQDWSSSAQIEFWGYGANSGNWLRLEVLDNRADGTTGDTAERFEFRFQDNWSGWKQIVVPWSAFQRRADWQPAGAPNDGFNRDRIHGFNLSLLNGSGGFGLDQIQLVK